MERFFGTWEAIVEWFCSYICRYRIQTCRRPSENIPERSWLVLLKDRRPRHFFTWFPIPSSWNEPRTYIFPAFLGNSVKHHGTSGFRGCSEGGKPRNMKGCCRLGGTLSVCPWSVHPVCSWSQTWRNDACHRTQGALVTSSDLLMFQVNLSVRQCSVLLPSSKSLSHSTVSWVKPKYLSQNIKGFNIPEEFVPKQP